MARIEALSLQPGDVIVLRYSHGTLTASRKWEILGGLQELFPHNFVLLAPDNWPLEQLDEEQMRAAGWERAVRPDTVVDSPPP